MSDYCGRCLLYCLRFFCISLLLLSNGSANLFDAPIVPMAGLLIADGVILAVNPPSGENRPYAFGDSQGKTNHGAQQGICREYVSIFLN